MPPSSLFGPLIVPPPPCQRNAIIVVLKFAFIPNGLAATFYVVACSSADLFIWGILEQRFMSTSVVQHLHRLYSHCVRWTFQPIVGAKQTSKFQFQQHGTHVTFLGSVSSFCSGRLEPDGSGNTTLFTVWVTDMVAPCLLYLIIRSSPFPLQASRTSG
jgi:hypothetical protein